MSSGGFGWDHEYPEESRSSEWTNDPEGEHTELIRDSSIESILETPFAQPPEFAQPSDDIVANALNDSVNAYDDETSSDVDESSSVPEVSVSPAVEGSQSAEDDDSIEAYMNRLLNRVQGPTGTDTTPTKSTPLVPTGNTEIPEPSKTVSDTSTAQSSETMPSIEPDAPLVPRSQAPERNSNLSAMRELANQSARTAVAHSVRIQARDTQIKAIVEFVKAGVAGVCAIAFYMFLDWPMWLKLMGVGAILVIAGVLAREGVVLFQEAKSRLGTSGAESDDASDHGSGESA